MKNIILIGMPGSGKTTVGSLLSKELGIPFIDADAYLEETLHTTIKELFAISEDAFRNAEEKVIQELSQKENIIIATGGGVVKRKRNIEHLSQSGVIYFLDRSPKEITTDVNIKTRPLLKEGKEKVYTLYEERIDLYREAAHHIVPNHESLDAVVAHILELIEK